MRQLFIAAGALGAEVGKTMGPRVRKELKEMNKRAPATGKL